MIFELGLPYEVAGLAVQGEQIGPGLAAEDHEVADHGGARARYRPREARARDTEERRHAPAPDLGTRLGVEFPDLPAPVGDVHGPAHYCWRGRDVARERGHPGGTEGADVVRAQLLLGRLKAPVGDALPAHSPAL